MVSTRAVKVKFFEGERVLCYEPDPTKAKVLYDSKVLEIIVNKDHRGRKSVEYLIHFQGWNSSWDRCVGEEYVLKDTAENRQLQKDLAEKSQLQFGTYLYRKERKKHSRKPNERASEEDGSTSSPGRMDTDDGQEQDDMSSSEDDSSFDEDLIPIELTPELREILEHDSFLINSKQKLLKLPAEPNVVTILENYWKHYVTSQFCILDKSNGKYRLSLSQAKTKVEDLQRNLVICKEVLDGLRLYFDFVIHDLLLYKSEVGQVPTMLPVDLSKINSLVKTEVESMDYLNNATNNHSNEDYCSHSNDNENGCRITRRRTLRSATSTESQTNGSNNHVDGVDSVKLSTKHENQEPGNPVKKLLSWKLLPNYVYKQQPAPPSLIYGAIHFTRLFVKLPELLAASSISDEKLKVLLCHIDMLIEFLTRHKEWYGDKNYTEE